MKVIRKLHGVFHNPKGLWNALINAVDDVLFDRFRDIFSYVDRFTIETSAGEILELWGIDYSVDRIVGESDASYRTRIKEALLGSGVTYTYIKASVDNFLAALGFVGDCTIVTWYQPNTLNLEPGWFAVDLPLEVDTGFFLDISHLDFVGSDRSVYESFLVKGNRHETRLRIPVIRENLNKIKASGIQYKITLQGVEK